FFLIFTQIPRERLGVMNGVAGMVISLAPALGPTYGGAVLAAGSWRVIFWLILPLALLSLIAGQLTIRNQPFGNSQPFSFGAL
ncbi:MFS transporter, partial [Roseburia hominis]|nr:MFS transporter [Roseburia hominis]